MIHFSILARLCCVLSIAASAALMIALGSAMR